MSLFSKNDKNTDNTTDKKAKRADKKAQKQAKELQTLSEGGKSGGSKGMSIRSKNGLFSTTLIVLAIVITLVFNLAVGQIPSGVMEIDLSATQLYKFSDTSKDYLSELDTDVQLIAVATQEDTDTRIVKFLQKYAALSDHVTLEWIDPVAYPSALTTYDCSSDTLVVICEETDRTYQVSFDSILVYDSYYYYYYGSTYYTSFDGEGQVLSAIDYVVSDSSYTVYCTENHGESDVGDNLADLLDKNHFTTETVSLLQTGSVPEDCDFLLIYVPTSDFSEEEINMIYDYLNAGGKVELIWGSTSFEHPNLDSLMATYGMELTTGYVGDTTRYYAATQSYFTFFPELSSSSDAADGISSDALVLVTNSFGLTLTDPERDTIDVDDFLGTTSSGGVMLDGDTTVSGEYYLGVTATEEIEVESEEEDEEDTDDADTDEDADSSAEAETDEADTSAEADSSAASDEDEEEEEEAETVTAQFTVLTSETLVNDDITSSFGDSIVNLTVVMNTITSNFEDVSNISIDAKSLETTYNTVTNAGLWSLLFLVALPIAVLIFGFVRWFRRRKL
ncbi:MAG: GldG family protein [Clostridiales bacterium]|nr:GldG family protein [Clostridiales bacterium]